MTENDVVKNVRATAIKGFIVMFLVALIPNIGFFVYLTDPDDKSLAWLFLIFAGLFDWLLIKTLITIINPLKDPVFRKYGSPKKIKEILNELNSNIVYEDENIIMSDKYITEKKDFSGLIAFEDVLGIHKLQHKKNGFTNYYGVILTDKYGYEHRYTYQVQNENKCDELIMITANLCPNAVVGYTNQQKQHIKENKVELKELPIDSDDEEKETFTCDNCGTEVDKDATECPNCGCTFIDDNENIEDNEEQFVCDNCGELVNISATKCPNCGELFEDDSEKESKGNTKNKENSKKKNDKESKSDIDQKYSDLNKLKKLLGKKIITKEEFEKEKKKILNK